MPFVKVKSLKFVEFTISKGICLWILEQTSHIDIKGIFCLQSLFKVSSGSIQHQRTKVLFLMLFHTMFNDFPVFIIKKLYLCKIVRSLSIQRTITIWPRMVFCTFSFVFMGCHLKRNYLIIFRIIFQPICQMILIESSISCKFTTYLTSDT